jgi:hypothetical protein
MLIGILSSLQKFIVKKRKKCQEQFMPTYKLCLKCKHIILFTANKAYLSVSYIFIPIHILLLLVFYFTFLDLVYIIFLGHNLRILYHCHIYSC